MRPIPKALFLMIVVAMLSGLGITPGWASLGQRAGFAKIGPLNMYYEVHGAGKPLLLLHGGGSTIKTTFGAVLPALAEQRLVIAPEQQGHGRTADIDRPLSFSQMADDTAELLRQLDVDKVDVLGFSNGGGVAIELALRHPELVDRLVLGSIYARRDSIRPELLAAFRQATPESMPDIYRRAYLEVAPNPEDLAKLTPKIMDNLLTFEGWSDTQLGAIGAPTMIVQAHNDVATLEHVVEMTHAIPNAQLLALPGGHGSYLGETLAAIPGSRLSDYAMGIILEFLDAK